MSAQPRAHQTVTCAGLSVLLRRVSATLRRTTLIG